MFGHLPETERATLADTIERMVAEFGLVVGRHVILHDAASIANRDVHAAFAAIYFGAPHHPQQDVVREIWRDNAPIIPAIGPDADMTDIPPFLQSLNALRRQNDDPAMIILAAAVLECVGLLRSQRRLFLSYRRVESRAAAWQLHDLLTARGFDVFLDTHDIRPGEPFQDILWHRLCDADAMVMLDTPTYFERKWTRQEFGRALAKEIHVLRVVWPHHQPSRHTDMAETIYLDSQEMEAPEGPIVPEKADEIVVAVEWLRARSVAARQRSIGGRLRTEAQRIGATAEGVGPNQAVSLRMPDDRMIYAYPVVGIPTAKLLNEIENKALQAGHRDKPALVYDHVGIRDAWKAHLKWLDDNIRTVRAIRVAEAAWSLAAWED